MLNDLILVTAVMAALLFGTAMFAPRFPKSVRPYLYVAFVEYQLCALYQYYNGADANGYREVGTELTRFLDAQFSWAAPEVLALMLHRPSAFDDVVFGAGSNTGSMCAAAAWIIFFVRGSAYAAQTLVAGLAMFGSFGVFLGLRDAAPKVSPVRLFVATVLFPSVAFWIAALHKEALCLMGMGLMLTSWRRLYRPQRLGAIIRGILGILIVAMFRTPVLAVLLLGLVLHVVVEQGRKTARGSMFSQPRYLLLGALVMAVGLYAVGRISPDLALDKLNDTVATQQGAWIQVANGRSGAGGSAFDVEEPVARSVASQIAQAPLSLVNALFRPQLFDVRSPSALVSALEMTALTVLLFTAIQRRTLKGVARDIRDSPFLLMCAAVTVIGCTFIGLTTRNWGTLARYRVPILPFYGSLIAVLTTRREEVAAVAGGLARKATVLSRAQLARARRPGRPAPGRSAA
ncbi:MAG: hypothetical protein JWP97_4735 [Labilithrix sp.]|nr:hypothetical protein [Labilithrix sp.]